MHMQIASIVTENIYYIELLVACTLNMCSKRNETRVEILYSAIPQQFLIMPEIWAYVRRRPIGYFQEPFVMISDSGLESGEVDMHNVSIYMYLYVIVCTCKYLYVPLSICSVCT